MSLLPDSRTSSYVVHDLEAGSAAARAGIHVGDRVEPAKHDMLSRATVAYPPPGAKVEVLVDGTRRVTLVETKSEPAHPIVSFMLVRLCFLAIAALLAWRRPDDASTRMLVWFLFSIGLGIALNNHEFGSALASMVFLLLFSFGAGARFAATFPEGAATGAPRVLAALATIVTTLAIAIVAASVLGIAPASLRQVAAGVV